MLASVLPGQPYTAIVMVIVAIVVTVLRRRRDRARLRGDVAAATELAQYSSWSGTRTMVEVEDFRRPPAGARVYLVGSYRKARWAQAHLGLNPTLTQIVQYPHQLDGLTGFQRVIVLPDAWELARAVELRDRLAELSVTGVKFLVLNI